jgi:hypothetical protein
VADCGARFEQPEQYTTHILTTEHDRDETAPEPVEALLAEHAKRMQRLEQEAGDTNRYFWDWYGFGEEYTEQHVVAEKEVMDQLEHDSLYYAQDKPVSEHRLLRLIHEVLISQS